MQRCACLKSVAASVTASQNRRYKQLQPRQDLAPRLCYLCLAWLAFSAPVGYCIFHNTTATLYYMSDCLSALLEMILCALTGGGYYDEAWRKVLDILLKEYTEKEREALKILSLKEEATQEDITQSYRELAKSWHPDHNSSKDAEAMFLKIHEAYQILMRRYKPNRFR
uniref:J domain-containing protein n=1 Tax=Knipowitschia caucasica TaxID=637954 RepID=A0AAV2LYL4_KNICA